MPNMTNYKPEDITPSMRKYLGVHETAQDSGTSEGAKKGWEKRHHGGGVSYDKKRSAEYRKRKNEGLESCQSGSNPYMSEQSVGDYEYATYYRSGYDKDGNKLSHGDHVLAADGKVYKVYGGPYGEGPCSYKSKKNGVHYGPTGEENHSPGDYLVSIYDPNAGGSGWVGRAHSNTLKRTTAPIASLPYGSFAWERAAMTGRALHGI